MVSKTEHPFSISSSVEQQIRIHNAWLMQSKLHDKWNERQHKIDREEKRRAAEREANKKSYAATAKSRTTSWKATEKKNRIDFIEGRNKRKTRHGRAKEKHEKVAKDMKQAHRSQDKKFHSFSLRTKLSGHISDSKEIKKIVCIKWRFFRRFSFVFRDYYSFLFSCIPFSSSLFQLSIPCFLLSIHESTVCFLYCCFGCWMLCVRVFRRKTNSKFNKKKSKSNPFRWKIFQCKITHIVTNLTCGVSQWQNGNGPTKQYLHVHWNVYITHFFTDIPINHLALALFRPIRRRSDFLHE